MFHNYVIQWNQSYVQNYPELNPHNNKIVHIIIISITHTGIMPYRGNKLPQTITNSYLHIFLFQPFAEVLMPLLTRKPNSCRY